MYAAYRSRGFLPLAINLGEDMETVVKYYARQHTYPFLRDEGDMAWNLYKMNGSIPLNYVIDTAGKVVNSMEGYSPDSILAWMGPYLTGYLFDVTNSYRMAFLLCAVISLTGILFAALLRRADQASAHA